MPRRGFFRPFWMMAFIWLLLFGCYSISNNLNFIDTSPKVVLEDYLVIRPDSNRIYSELCLKDSLLVLHDKLSKSIIIIDLARDDDNYELPYGQVSFIRNGELKCNCKEINLGDTFYMQYEDISYSRIIGVDLKSKELTPNTMIKLSQNMPIINSYSIFLDKNTIVGSTTDPKGVVFKIENDSINYFGNHPQLGDLSKINNFQKEFIYTTTADLDIGTKEIAIVYNYINQIKLCNYEIGSCRTIQFDTSEPLNFNNYSKDENGFSLYGNKFYFSRVKLYDNLIFALYEGTFFDEEDWMYKGNQLIILDKKGALVNSYKFPVCVIDIAWDDKHEFLYALTEIEDQELIRFDNFKIY